MFSWLILRWTSGDVKDSTLLTRTCGFLVLICSASVSGGEQVRDTNLNPSLARSASHHTSHYHCSHLSEGFIADQGCHQRLTFTPSGGVGALHRRVFTELAVAWPRAVGKQTRVGQWPSFSFIHKTEIMLCFIASKIDVLKYAWGTYWWETFIMLRTTTAVHGNHQKLSLKSIIKAYKPPHRRAKHCKGGVNHTQIPEKYDEKVHEKYFPQIHNSQSATNLSFIWRKCLLYCLVEYLQVKWPIQ